MVKNIIKTFSCVVALSTGLMAQADFEDLGQEASSAGLGYRVLAAGTAIDIDSLPEGIEPQGSTYTFAKPEGPCSPQVLASYEDGEASFIRDARERVIAGLPSSLEACAFGFETDNLMTWRETLQLSSEELLALQRLEASPQVDQQASEPASGTGSVIANTRSHPVSHTGSLNVQNIAAPGALTAHRGSGTITGMVGGTAVPAAGTIRASTGSITVDNKSMAGSGAPAAPLGKVTIHNSATPTTPIVGTLSCGKGPVTIVNTDATANIGLIDCEHAASLYIKNERGTFPSAVHFGQTPGYFYNNGTMVNDIYLNSQATYNQTRFGYTTGGVYCGGQRHRSRGLRLFMNW